MNFGLLEVQAIGLKEIEEVLSSPWEMRYTTESENLQASNC